MIDLGQYDAIKYERKNNSDVFNNFKRRCKSTDWSEFDREVKGLKEKENNSHEA